MQQEIDLKCNLMITHSFCAISRLCTYATSLVPRPEEKRPGNFCEFKLYTDEMSR